MFFNKEINKLISNVKYLLLRKTDVLKTFRKRKFLRKKIWRNALALKSKKVQGSVYFGIIVFCCLWSAKPCPRFLLIWFAREIKSFYQSFLRNEVEFRDIILKIKVIKIKKNCDTVLHKKEYWQEDINIFLSLENLCSFLLAK